jgi:hypothetical protein
LFHRRRFVPSALSTSPGIVIDIPSERLSTSPEYAIAAESLFDIELDRRGRVARWFPKDFRENIDGW